MRIAILSDIHSNLEAFHKVLGDIDRCCVDSVISLGDNIGYGPDPQEVMELLWKRSIPSVMGNHELGIIDGPFRGSWFNPSARRSLEITRSMLARETIDFIKELRYSMSIHGCLFVHGYPPESATRYLFDVSRRELHRSFIEMEQNVCFVGHTHDLVLISFDGQRVERTELEKGSQQLQQGHRYIINAGSVGQPRDGDKHSKYLLWDSDSWELEVRYVSYDSAGTARKILDLGFPAVNAHRLL